MGEAILVFIGKCLWGFACIMALIGPFVLLFWFIVGTIQSLIQIWKGKGGSNYRFPPW